MSEQHESEQQERAQHERAIAMAVAALGDLGYSVVRVCPPDPAEYGDLSTDEEEELR